MGQKKKFRDSARHNLPVVWEEEEEEEEKKEEEKDNVLRSMVVGIRGGGGGTRKCSPAFQTVADGKVGRSMRMMYPAQYLS